MSGGRLYSRRLTAPSGLRVDGAAGLTPWAPRVLSGTGWRLPDGFKAFGPGSYIVPLRWRGMAPYGAIIYRLTAE